MLEICKKEWQQFFGSLTGYLAIIIFLLINSLILFVFPDTSILQFGYATLQGFFTNVVWVLLFLVPVITMRSIADELKTGTFELLATLPLSNWHIVLGKFFGCLLVATTALIPTIVYAVSVQQLSATGGIDIGGTIGSYVGLWLLTAAFTAIGIAASSYTNNTVVAFVIAASASFIVFSGFTAISKLSVVAAIAYYIELLGIQFHYQSLSRGVIDTRDVIYFLALIFLCLSITKQNLEQRS
ncbi:MAG: ABC transporter permease subunit [Chitinophagaceae bacterium]